MHLALDDAVVEGQDLVLDRLLQEQRLQLGRVRLDVARVGLRVGDRVRQVRFRHAGLPRDGGGVHRAGARSDSGQRRGHRCVEVRTGGRQVVTQHRRRREVEPQVFDVLAQLMAAERSPSLINLMRAPAARAASMPTTAGISVSRSTSGAVAAVTEVERFASGEYLQALFRGDSLKELRPELLCRLSGLKAPGAVV